VQSASDAGGRYRSQLNRQKNNSLHILEYGKAIFHGSCAAYRADDNKSVVSARILTKEVIKKCLTGGHKAKAIVQSNRTKWPYQQLSG